MTQEEHLLQGYHLSTSFFKPHSIDITNETDSNAYFIIEKSDLSLGGPIYVGGDEPLPGYRLRHLNSGRYLYKSNGLQLLAAPTSLSNADRQMSAASAVSSASSTGNPSNSLNNNGSNNNNNNSNNNTPTGNNSSKSFNSKSRSVGNVNSSSMRRFNSGEDGVGNMPYDLPSFDQQQHTNFSKKRASMFSNNMERRQSSSSYNSGFSTNQYRGSNPLNDLGESSSSSSFLNGGSSASIPPMTKKPSIDFGYGDSFHENELRRPEVINDDDEENSEPNCKSLLI